MTNILALSRDFGRFFFLYELILREDFTESPWKFTLLNNYIYLFFLAVFHLDESKAFAPFSLVEYFFLQRKMLFSKLKFMGSRQSAGI